MKKGKIDFFIIENFIVKELMTTTYSISFQQYIYDNIRIYYKHLLIITDFVGCRRRKWIAR